MEQKNRIARGVKMLFSYGGRFEQRPTDHRLVYAGGNNVVLTIDRYVNLSGIIDKLNSHSNGSTGGKISVKYQLPGEDLDYLISLIDDEDVEHMMVEYDRMQTITPKPARFRIFVFSISSPPTNPVTVEPAHTTIPDYLTGFDEECPPLTSATTLPESGLKSGCLINNVNGAAPAAYAVPDVVNEGVYGTGAYQYGIDNGNWEQPVYNIVPIMPPHIVNVHQCCLRRIYW